MCTCARTERENMHPTFVPFLGQFFFIFEALPDQKLKNEATLQIDIDEAHLFHFIHFLCFRYGSPPKWPKGVKNFQKSTFMAT